MTGNKNCPKCGGPLVVGALEGLCPKCLATLSFSAEDEPSSARSTSSNVSSRVRYFGDYELLTEIARGGSGVVYKARQVSLNRFVAVKMLLVRNLGREEFVRRFKAEAESAALLQHHNIVRIHEVGEHEGQHYFSMDYVEGQSLAERARDNPLPPEIAADYVKIIASAIHYAHQRGILHRDLKPSNILIDAQDQPRITDFGLAKRLDEDQDFTQTGQVMGTPHYMAPEQAKGLRGEITVATDVYGLGGILYYLLTGQSPFMADSMERVLHRVLNDEPEAPHVLNPGTPRDLETVCVKCLQKEPAKRYATAERVADDLARFMRGESVQARRVSAAEKLWRWCRRRPAIAGLLLALHIALALGLAGVLWQWHRAELNATVARTNLHESYLAQAQALRVSSKAGRRLSALEAIGKAAIIQPSFDLRNEAIANLAHADFHVTNAHSVLEFGDCETFNVDFTLAAVRPSRGRIEVQHAFSRAVVAEIPQLRGDITVLRLFSPDHRYFAFVSSTDGTCIWDLVHGRIVLGGMSGDTAGDFTPDSRVFAIGAPNGSIDLFDLAAGSKLRRLGQHVPNQGVAFDPAGQRLACWDVDRLEIIDATTGEPVRRLEMLGGSTDHALGAARRVAWSANGDLLVAAGPDRRIYLWRGDNGQLLQVFLGHAEPVMSVAMSPSSQFIATAGFDETTRLWEVLTGRMLANVPGVAWNLAFSKDGRYLGPGRLGTSSNCLFEVIQPQCFHRLAPSVPETSNRKVHAMDFSLDGRLVAVAGADGVRLWDRHTGQLAATLPTIGACSVLFDTSSGALLISASGELSRWPLRYDVQSGTNVLFIGPPQEIGLGEKSWGFASVGTQTSKLAVASAERPAVIMSLGASTNFVRLNTVHELGHYIDLSPDGRFVATGSGGGNGVRIWDAETGRLLHAHPAKGYAAVAFSPDGRWLMVGGYEYHALRVGSWTNWHVVQPFTGEHVLGMMAFSPDGRLWARFKTSTSYELVEPGSWRSLAVLQSPFPLGLGWPRFSRDGTLFAAGDGGFGVQIWDLRELRAALRPLGLDWDLPPYPPSTSGADANPIVARIVTK